MTTQYDKLLKLSPYPIHNGLSPIYDGWLHWGDNTGKAIYAQNRDFKPSIMINQHIKSNPKRIAVLLHEIGHAQHHKRHCKCYLLDDRKLREYHAERFALRYMLRYKLTGALRYEVNELIKNKCRYLQFWQDIISQLQQDKIWQKCKNYLDNR